MTARFMKKTLKHNLLPVSVFITGSCVLIVEVVAVRALSPYYGNTIFTVSSVISVILAALSIGYYVGGKFSDGHPSLRWFFGIILVSGLAILALYFLGTIILPILSINFSLISGPLVSSLLLFFAPALLLGTMSPYAVKLQSVQFPKQGVGSIAGKIFFWSTLGSIIGSLLAGFILIPNFGVDHIFITTGVVLFFLGFIPLALFGSEKKRLFQSLLVFVIFTVITLFAAQQAEGGVIYSKDGVYEKITIYDGVYGNRPTRFFQQDRSGSSAMFLDSDDQTDLVYDYTKYYSVYQVFKPDVQNALIIGGGAYSIPKALLAELPNTTVDVSEIEPSLFGLAREYFGLKDDSRLQNFTEDGRRLLRDSDKKYDLIFSDVYSLFSIPAHFTTQEFFGIARDKLTPDGIFVANLIGNLSRQQLSLIMAEIKTFRSVFPNSYFFAVESPVSTDSQNIIFVGYNSNNAIDLKSPAIAQHPDLIIRSLRDKEIAIDRFELSPYPILTDNFSPVEYLTAIVLQRTFGEKPFIDGDEMIAVIEQQLRYGPRYMSAPGHKEVQKFLIAEMKALTNQVKTQTGDYTGSDGKTHKLTNIIGSLYPSQERRMVLATHYDSKRLADKDLVHKDQPVPGANDSASGVAILIELARILRNSHVLPNVGIDFVFFDGEEGDENQGGDYSDWKPLGSTYFAGNLDELYRNNKPISAIVIDMVCDKDLRIYKERSSVQEAPSQVEAFWNVAKKMDNSAFQDQISQVIRDDHTPLNQAGIPSILLIDFEYSPFHTTQDTADKCDANSLQTVAETVWEYINSGI